MEEVFEFLKKCGTYYLATVEGDQPHVRGCVRPALTYSNILQRETGLRGSHFWLSHKFHL